MVFGTFVNSHREPEVDVPTRSQRSSGGVDTKRSVVPMILNQPLLKMLCEFGGEFWGGADDEAFVSRWRCGALIYVCSFEHKENIKWDCGESSCVCVSSYCIGRVKAWA